MRSTPSSTRSRRNWRRERVAEGLVVDESGEVRAREGLPAHGRRGPVRHVLEGERFEHEVRGPRQVALHELPA